NAQRSTCRHRWRGQDIHPATAIEKIQRSSVVERSAVNRLVVGSNPTAGANSMSWVYVLQNPAGRFYIGHTDNLERRVKSHNRTDKISGKFTRKNEPWILIWSEKHLACSTLMRSKQALNALSAAGKIRIRLLRLKKSRVGKC